MRYPKEAVVFEVTRQRAGAGGLPIGTHVEVAGSCCLNYTRAWTCGVFVINNYRLEEHEAYQWVGDLRPLTKAAKQMLAISLEARGK
jgi:hypothetical protein